MLTAAVAVLSLSMGATSTLWIDVCDMDAGTAQIPQEGEYYLWAWAPAQSDNWVNVANHQWDFKAKEDKNASGYVWYKLGKQGLDAGKIKIDHGNGVMALVATTSEQVAPEALMKDTRVFDQPNRAEDRRASTAKHTNTVFMMDEFSSIAEWEGLADTLRRRTLIASGLWPLPEKTPLNAVIKDRVEHPDYTVEKVHFEAYPGFLVTGNLYRPVGDGPYPAVVCPHGHWGDGRLVDDERGCVAARCITLARMGIAAFSYDMIGYVDSKQFPHNWGGEEEKLWGLHPFAMQLWTSIRAVDFVEALAEVDKERIGCTGASGGGTQTFALCAVEPRIKVSAPVNMISSRMQGGCLCENAPIIRLENSNMEIGALMAPRPMILISATGDWTRETERVEFPAIRSIYALYGAEDRIENVHVDAGHNYNQASREGVYKFFAKWLLGKELPADYTEPAYTLEDLNDLRVFPGDTKPEGYPTDKEIKKNFVKDVAAKWAAQLPADAAAAPAFQTAQANLITDTLGVERPAVNDLRCERLGYEERGDYVVERWLLGRADTGDAVPAIFYRAYQGTSQQAVVLVDEGGKAAWANPDGGPGALVQELLAAGKAVLCIDAFLLGEHNGPTQKAERLRVGGFMDTFQPTDFGYRVQDVLTAAAFLRARRDIEAGFGLVGMGDAGMWALFAAAADDSYTAIAADLNKFKVDDDKAWVKTHYTPCIRAIGDIDTAIALTVPRKLVLMNPLKPMENTLGAEVSKTTLDTQALLAFLQ